MDQHQKHRCKFCRKTFRCGRSLGGHMRCHVSSPMTAAAADEEKMQASRGGVQGGLPVGYGLRENPKKTWRVSDPTTTVASFGDLREKSCRECGREFQSWKALFGHMRCHSQKIGKAEEEKQQQEDDEEQGSWSGEGGSHIGGGEIAVAVPKKKRRSRRAGSVLAPVPDSSYSISEYAKEQEDVAGILMMLSRDVGYWGHGFDFGFSHVAESSDKNSVVLVDGGLRSKNSVFDGEFEENSDKPFENNKKRMGSDGIDSDVKKYSLDSVDSKLGSKYECTTCNKSFHTYQALGGHRASHKKMRGCFMAPKTAAKGSEQRLENAAAASIDKQAAVNHQCHICGKVFSSGQALGGHKRSHLVMASPCTVVIRQQEEEEEEEEAVAMSDLIDLNLPAPVDEDSSKGSVSVAAVGDEYRSWWAGSNLQHEGMIGMIAN